MFPSIWSTFFLQKYLILSNGFVPLRVVSSVCRGRWRKTRGMGVLKWVSLRVCARSNFGAKYLLCQTQSQARFPLWLWVPQWNWGLISLEYPLIQPHNWNCDPSVNPACDVQISTSSFASMSQLKVASTTSASLPIISSTEIKMEKIYHLVKTCLTMFFLPSFLLTQQQLIHSNWIPSIHVIISKPDFNNRFCLALP